MFGACLLLFALRPHGCPPQDPLDQLCGDRPTPRCPIVMESLDPAVEMRRAEPEPPKGILADVALVRLHQGVDWCVRAKVADKKAASLKAQELFLATGKTVLGMVCKERLGGGNPYEAGGVYRTPRVAGALDELSTIQRHFRSSFGAAALILEAILLNMVHEAQEEVWRLHPSLDLNNEALKWGELFLYLVRG